MWSRARDGEWARVRVDDAERATSGIRLSSRPTARKHEETGEELATKERHSALVFSSPHSPKGLCVYQKIHVTREIFHGIPLKSLA